MGLTNRRNRSAQSIRTQRFSSESARSESSPAMELSPDERWRTRRTTLNQSDMSQRSLQNNQRALNDLVLRATKAESQLEAMQRENRTLARYQESLERELSGWRAAGTELGVFSSEELADELRAQRQQRASSKSALDLLDEPLSQSMLSLISELSTTTGLPQKDLLRVLLLEGASQLWNNRSGDHAVVEENSR